MHETCKPIMNNVNKSIIVIGDGIVGSCLIYLLSRLGYENILNVTSNHHKSSVNNQTWLQSGALYNTDMPQQAKVARLLALHGPELEQEFNLPSHSKKGIIGVKTQKEAKDKIAYFEKFGKYFTYLGHEEANFLLKDFYSRDLTYINVPDHPFDESTILNTCRAVGEGHGVSFIEAKECYIIQKDKTLKVEIDGKIFDSDIVFLAGGVGTKKILNQIEMPIPINAFRSLLLSVPYNFNCGVEMFADQKRNINFIDVSSLSNSNLYLLGNGMRSNTVNMFGDFKNYKEVHTAEYNEFVENLSSFPKIKDVLVNNCQLKNLNACFKVEHIVKNTPNYFPWIFSSKNFKSISSNNLLVVGGAGKATLGLFTAKKMLIESGIDPNIDGSLPPPNLNKSGPHTPWFGR